MDRVILGQRHGQYDLWVSKPGVDVKYAVHGQLLLGGNTGVNQILASGVNQLAGPPSFTGPQDYAVSLPASLAGMTDLLVWGQLYRVDGGGGVSVFTQSYQYGGFNHGAFRVVGGSLIVSSFVATTYGTPQNPTSLWCQWAIFRAAYG